jgi:hypothetical protein
MKNTGDIGQPCVNSFIYFFQNLTYFLSFYKFSYCDQTLYQFYQMTWYSIFCLISHNLLCRIESNAALKSTNKMYVSKLLNNKIFALQE